MALYKDLYGKHCGSPLGMYELGEARLLCIGMVDDAFENVKLIQDRLCTM